MSRHTQAEPLSITIDPGTVYISTNPKQTSYVNLTVSIQNTGAATVSLSSVAITLPSALAPPATLGSIIPVADQSTLWNFGPSEFKESEFDAIPVNGSAVGLDANGIWSFELQMVTLVSEITHPSADVTAAIVFADGSKSSTTLQVDITAAVATIKFSAEPSYISPGESSTLTWTCENVDYCIISPISGNHLDPSGTMQVAPETDTTYVLYAYTGGAILSAQWSVDLDIPQIRMFEGDKGQLRVNYGDNITLIWACNPLTQSVSMTSDSGVTIPPLNENGNTPQKGSITVGPLLRPVTFILSAYGGNDQNPDQHDCLIMINDIVCDFTANPGTGIWAGDKVTLSWNIESVSAVSLAPPLDNGPSLQNLSGSTVINPTDDVPYVLSVSGYINDQPVTNQLTNLPLTVEKVVINSFTLTPAVIVPGTNPNQTTLAWDTQAQSVLISNGLGVQPVTGSVVLNAPVNGTIYALLAGTNQNPGTNSSTVVVGNQYGPFTFNAINNGAPGGYNLLEIDLIVPDTTGMNVFNLVPPNDLFTVNLTGVTPLGGAPSAYYAAPYYNTNLSPAQWVFGIMGSANGLTGLQWADSNNPTGTVTLTGTMNPEFENLSEELQQHAQLLKTKMKT